MKVMIAVNDTEVYFERNWFTGRFTYTVNGITSVLVPALRLSTHFSVRLSETYKLTIGDHIVTVLKERPLLLAGLRPHTYRFYMGDRLLKEVVSL